MAILLSVLNLASAAFVIWLAVRIVNRRERWAVWTAVVLVMGMAALTIWWWTRPHEGILFDPIEIQVERL
jgi:hypothetical protein